MTRYSDMGQEERTAWLIEHWKAVLGFEGRYWISDHGHVKTHTGLILKDQLVTGTGPREYGYRKINLSTADGREQAFRIHRLVLVAFVGPSPDGTEACHNNGDASDNRLANLRWDTPKANQNDRRLHGTALAGSNHPSAKLSDVDVLEIRALKSKGILSTKECCSRFGVTHSTISRIAAGRLWRHLP